MVTPDDLIARIMQRPFVPYVVRLKKGDEILISEPHYAATSRKASTCTIVPPGEGGFRTINFADIDSLIIPENAPH